MLLNPLAFYLCFSTWDETWHLNWIDLDGGVKFKTYKSTSLLSPTEFWWAVLKVSETSPVTETSIVSVVRELISVIRVKEKPHRKESCLRQVDQYLRFQFTSKIFSSQEQIHLLHNNAPQFFESHCLLLLLKLPSGHTWRQAPQESWGETEDHRSPLWSLEHFPWEKDPKWSFPLGISRPFSSLEGFQWLWQFVAVVVVIVTSWPT